jgi:hypothetical protein
MKVRTDFPPNQFDGQGNLEGALTGKSKWPGKYLGEVDMLKVGQVVDVYIARTGKLTPGPTNLPAAGTRPKALLIVILKESAAK